VKSSVSAIVCTHDLGRWDALARAVQSLQDQTYRPLELIVVVDHNDRLLERARAELDGVTAVANHHERGLSGARNTAVAQACGELVAFLDDDAEAGPDWLDLLASRCEDDGVLGAGGRVVPRWLGERPAWFPDEFLWVVGCTYEGVPAMSAPVRNLYGGCFCIRRSVLERIGGFRTELGRVGANRMGCEETELCIRAARETGGGFWYEPAAVIVHDVPAARATWSYFTSRCFGEGVSKARLSQLVGAGAGLSTERTYVRRALPAGVVRGLRDALSGRDPAGLLRAAAIVAGLCVTAAAYGRELASARRPS
jgi:GT2 family glycosyltransferase